MAKSRSGRLHSVLLLAEREEREIRSGVQKLQLQLERQQLQLGQLKDYCEEYRTRINNQKGQQFVKDIILYRQFLQQLAHAEKSQSDSILVLQRQLEKYKLIWRKKYQYKKAIQNLIEKAKKEEQNVLEKREQKQVEEIVMRNSSTYPS